MIVWFKGKCWQGKVIFKERLTTLLAEENEPFRPLDIQVSGPCAVALALAGLNPGQET